MTDLRAFVGHSFSEEDEVVVGSFLKFFETLEKGVMPFRWEHALEAEPRDLAAKVLERIAGKNVFIGICTRKERVLKKEPHFSLGGISVGRPEYEWKTSDWIIQEIGLSIGRNMHPVLLVEDGVRLPGGLQGNLNYIPFTRDLPQKSFVQILEMLKSLSPKPASESTAAPEHSDTPTQHKAIEPEWANPKPEWRKDDFEFAMFWSILRRNGDKQKEIETAFMASDIASDSSAVAEWRGTVEVQKLEHGEGGKLDTLRQLASRNQTNPSILCSLARGLDHFEKYAEAAGIYETAASIANGPETAIKYLASAAESYVKAHDQLRAEALANSIRELALTSGNERSGIYALIRLCDAIKRPLLVLTLRERLADLRPDDTEDRFNLAYRHSQDGGHDLALYHYTRISERNRSAMAHNNIGVAYSHFDLRCLAVQSLEKARLQGETLAFSNIADRHLRAGLMDTARSLCEEALQHPNCHPNVNLTLSRVNEAVEKEGKERDEIISSGRRKSEFLRRFGRASTLPSPRALAPRLVHPAYGPLTLTLTDGRLVATGSFKRNVNTANALMFPFGTRSPNERTVAVTISGVLFGCAAECELSLDDGTPKSSTLLGLIDQTVSLLMYLDDNSTCWHLLERPFTSGTAYSTLIVPAT